MGVSKTVSKLHFEDFSGNLFQRLAFAYVSRLRSWDGGLQWLGETGKDSGRDIWENHAGETYCYQCANYKNLTLSKGTEDIDKLATGKHI